VIREDTMRKPHVIPHFTSTLDFEKYLPTSPILSSKETSWESVMVRAYHEPSALEETPFPAGPDIYLVWVTSGAVRVDERKPNGWRLNGFRYFAKYNRGNEYVRTHTR
jgi:hypothetical protein